NLSRVLEEPSYQRVLRAEPRFVVEPEGQSDRLLVFGQQPLPPPSADGVQSRPNPEQEGMRLGKTLALDRAKHSFICEPGPESGFDPAERVEVPQAAPALLDVGLQEVGGRTGALVPG